MYIVIVVNHVFISHIDPPGFVDVSVCLDVNMTGCTELDIYYTVSCCGKYWISVRYQKLSISGNAFTDNCFYMYMYTFPCSIV